MGVSEGFNAGSKAGFRESKSRMLPLLLPFGKVKVTDWDSVIHCNVCLFFSVFHLCLPAVSSSLLSSVSEEWRETRAKAASSVMKLSSAS